MSAADSQSGSSAASSDFEHKDKAVVINFGSLFLRVGFSTDFEPHQVPCCIAWKCKEGAQNETQDEEMVDLIDYSSMRSEGLKQIHNRIRSEKRGKGRKKGLGEESFGRMEGKADPEEVYGWRDPNEELPGYLVGEDVFKLLPTDKFQVVWPIKEGRLAVNSKLSIMALRENLVTILNHILKNKMGLNPKDYKDRPVVLALPDDFIRRDVKEIVDLILNEMGFKEVLVHLESVCSCFGAGQSTACVVDIGHEKTSVACVDEGFCNPASRFTMPYGGSDMEQCLLRLLADVQPPLPIRDMTHQDVQILRKMKEECCELGSENIGNSVEFRFALTAPGTDQANAYFYKIGGERIFCTLGLFHPRLWAKPELLFQELGDYDDLADDFFQEVQEKNKKKQMEAKAEAELAAGGAPGTDAAPDVVPMEEELPPEEGFIALHKAVVDSVMKIERPEVRKRLFSCILLTGGPAEMRGLKDTIERRVETSLPQGEADATVKVLVNHKVSPSTTTWRGAAIMSNMEGCIDMFISRSEWNTHGVAALRLRSAFQW